MNTHDTNTNTNTNKVAMMPNPIRIAVIDNHPMFREGVVRTLKRVDGFEIVGEGATATDAFKIAQECALDVILLGLCIPGGGIEAAAGIARDWPNVRTAILAVSEFEHDVTAALQAGARGYLLKGSGGPEVVKAVHAVVRGDFYFAPNLAARLLTGQNRRMEAVANDNL